MSGSATTGSSANYVSSWSFCFVVTPCGWVSRILSNIYEKVRASFLRVLQEQWFLYSCWTVLKMDAVHFTKHQIPDCWNLHQHCHGDLKFRALYRSIIGSKDNYSTQTKKQLSVYAILKGILHYHIGITERCAIKMHRGWSVLIRISYKEFSLLGCFPAREQETPRCVTITSMQKTSDMKSWKSDTVRKLQRT